MKKIFTLFLLFWVISLSAQQAGDFTDNQSERPRDPRTDQMNFVPNEVLVKFKDDVAINSGTKLKSAGVNSVDKVLKATGGSTLEKLFPNEKKLKSAQFVKDPQGREMKIPSLHNIYKIIIPQTKSSGSAPANIFKIIEELKALPEVEYAEPNYIYSIDDLKPVGPILSASDLVDFKNESLKSAEGAVVPNDPLYSQQWYIPAIKADLVWNETIGDTSQVIGILDTGVDWLHPDLMNKIWINPGEIPDNGIDDDGNGLIDDVRGWDYINNDNNPMDDNSHGTHVAGIAAAESNNGIGIAGVNWKAKILPIKVFPSSGITDISTIVPGILYAADHDATVINMSFCTYANSLTLNNAIEYAYGKGSLLVGSAGNDSHSIYDYDSQSHLSLAAFPAANPLVFGVQANASFSNYDPDGPVYSEYEQGYNYELTAPGMGIISTIPNGNYRQLSGTSMSAPIVSGIISLYRSAFSAKSIEELWSDMIHSSNEIIDAEKALFDSNNRFFLDLKSYQIRDTSYNCDNDGKADAGEIVDLFLQIRNTGDPASQVYVKIKPAYDGNANDITILNDSVYFGSIGTYRTLINNSNSFRLKINPDCQNNSSVSLEVTIRDAQVKDSLSTQNIKFKVYNGAELSGILLKDTTLTPDKKWVINNSLRISSNVTLTILPGTNLEVLAGVDNRGTVYAVGTNDNKITMKGAIGGNTVYEYVDIDLNGGGLSATKINKSAVRNGYNVIIDSIKNSILSNITIIRGSFYRSYIKDVTIFGLNGGSIIQSVFDNNVIGDILIDNNYYNFSSISYNLFANIENYNNIYNPFYYNNVRNIGYAIVLNSENNNINKNTFLRNGTGTYFIKTNGSDDITSLSNQYWGTLDNVKIKKKYYDFTLNSAIPYLNVEPKLVLPSDSCPGHVWKVLVNGKDAQDEVLEPVGIGKQRFDVYFNRSMDKAITPKVSFGGLYPYTSNPINEDGSWSEDGKIYSVFKTIKLTTIDGINRIRVAAAKQAGDWGWEIPVEDRRFNFLISAAGSASIAFMATPGLGKVNLEWNNNQLADGLGFNMYRMEKINDSILSNPLLINSTLIADTLYTDFAVTPNKKYYYYYKILRTNLAETDSSKVVSTIPLTASKGDANGDLTVNVLDITTLVTYLLNQNPQPFIIEAADVNSDGLVNVLDIIGVVKAISSGKKKIGSTTATNPVPAYIYLKPDKIKLRSEEQVAAIQFTLKGSNLKDVKLSSLLDGFEFIYQATDTTLIGILFSFSGKIVPAGLQDILKVEAGNAILNWANVMGGDTKGQYVTIIPAGEVVPVPETFIANAFPNPSSGEITIGFELPENANVTINIYNLYGQLISTLKDATLIFGSHEVHWQASSAGVYICRIKAIGEDVNKKQYSKDIKLIVIR